MEVGEKVAGYGERGGRGEGREWIDGHAIIRKLGAWNTEGKQGH